MAQQLPLFQDLPDTERAEQSKNYIDGYWAVSSPDAIRDVVMPVYVDLGGNTYLNWQDAKKKKRRRYLDNEEVEMYKSFNNYSICHTGRLHSVNPAEIEKMKEEVFKFRTENKSTKPAKGKETENTNSSSTKEIKDQLDALRAEHSDLINRFNNLKLEQSRADELQEKFLKVNNDYIEIQNQMSGLNDNIEQKQREIENLHEMINTLESSDDKNQEISCKFK